MSFSILKLLIMIALIKHSNWQKIKIETKDYFSYSVIILLLFAHLILLKNLLKELNLFAPKYSLYELSLFNEKSKNLHV